MIPSHLCLLWWDVISTHVLFGAQVLGLLGALSCIFNASLQLCRILSASIFPSSMSSSRHNYSAACSTSSSTSTHLHTKPLTRHPLKSLVMLGVNEVVISGGVGVMPPSFPLRRFVNLSSYPKLFLRENVRILDIGHGLRQTWFNVLLVCFLPFFFDVLLYLNYPIITILSCP